MKKILILGAGISGLSLAWFLKKRHGNNIEITILEKSSRVGGWIQTRNQQGYLFELGPHSCRPQGPGESTLHLIESLNLQDQVITPDSAAKRRYLWMDHHLQPLPNNLISMFTSPLMRGLLPSLWKDLRTSRSSEEDEDIHSFFTRRFGEHIANQFIDPLVTGIYAGDPKKLSIKSCFPLWHTWEQQSGSVLWGWLKSRKSRKNSSAFVRSLSKAPFFSLKNGMETLPQELEKHLSGCIHKDSEVVSMNFASDFIGVDTADGRQWEADHVYSTLPARALANLLKPHRPEIYEQLNNIPSASTAIVSLGYNQQVLNERGFGYLIPSHAQQEILGMIWDSSIFPQQNKSSNETRLTVMLGGMLQPEVCQLSDSEIVVKALSAGAKHLGIGVLPEAMHVSRATEAIPQYFVGHSRTVERVEEAVSKLSSRLTCLGSAFHGVSVNDSIARSLKVCNETAVNKV